MAEGRWDQGGFTLAFFDTGIFRVVVARVVVDLVESERPS